jgi:uncharacterized protein YjbI with pentapeptide repeats
MARTAKRRPGPPHAIQLPELASAESVTLEPHEEYEALHMLDRDLAGLDMSNSSFLGCRFERCRMDDVTLVRGRISECLLTEIGATGLDASDSTWRDSILSDVRIGALAAVRAAWSSVRVRGSKLDFLALAGGRVDDVAFEDCVIEELDLGDARLRNVTFAGCRIGVLDVEGAQLMDVDLTGTTLRTIRGIAGLRGATVSPAQLMELGPLLANHLGIRVGDGG